MPGVKPLQTDESADGLVLNAGQARGALQRLAAISDCLERLLSQSAQLPVPVPTAGLMMLCSRMLSVDDTLRATGALTLGAVLLSSVIIINDVKCFATSWRRLVRRAGGQALKAFIWRLQGRLRLLAQHITCC